MKKYQCNFTFYGREIVYVYMLAVMVFAPSCQEKAKKNNIKTQKADTFLLETTPKTSTASGVKETFPGGDAFQQDCEFIQDQAEVLLEEFHRQETTEASSKQIIERIKELDSQWKKTDCGQVFGFMLPNIPSLPRVGKATEADTNQLH